MVAQNRTGWNKFLGILTRAQAASGNAKSTLRPLPINPRSLLFIEMTRLGDVVTMLPLIQSVRNAWPMVRITVAVHADYAGFFKYLPFVDTVIPLSLSQSPMGFFRARSIVRKKRYDLVIPASPARRNAVLALGARAHMKAGYFTTPSTTATFLDSSSVIGIGLRTKNVPAYHMENISVRSQRIADALAIPYTSNIGWDIPRAIQDSVRTHVLRSSGVSGSRFIVLHPFAGWEYREWDMRNYLTLAGELSATHTVVIAGTKEELARPAMMQQLPQGVVQYEITTLEDYFALLIQAELFIGSDSGPLHAAASMGVAHIGLFGPAAPALTGPVGRNGTLLYHAMECSPCNQSVCVHPERSCMTFIQFADIVRSARGILLRESVA